MTPPKSIVVPYPFLISVVNPWPHPHHLWSIYIFLVSVVRPHCILTSEDLELVTTDEGEYVAFVFWGLCSMVPETTLQTEGKEVIK